MPGSTAPLHRWEQVGVYFKGHQATEEVVAESRDTEEEGGEEKKQAGLSNN